MNATKLARHSTNCLCSLKTWAQEKDCDCELGQLRASEQLKINLIKAAIKLSDHLSEFDGVMHGQEYLDAMDECLIQICNVNTWDEVLEFAAKN